MVCQGLSSTVGVTLETMRHHTDSVARGLRRANGKPADLSEDTKLEGGDTLVLSGKPGALAMAEENLLRRRTPMPELQKLNRAGISAYLKSHIRTVPDWPAPGVQFRDITPLLQNPKVFRVLIDAFVHRYMDPDLRPDVVAGLDARGFILG
eukprot:gene1728-2156_t